jgi:NAD+ kinase
VKVNEVTHTFGNDFKTLGIFLNPQKEKVFDLIPVLVEFFHENGRRVLIDERGSDRLREDYEFLPRERICEKAEMIIALGGDGTILASARTIGRRVLPLLGINVGSLGFLAEVTEFNLFQSLKRLIEGKFHIEERASLKVDFLSGTRIPAQYALNDVIVTRSSTSRIFEIDTHVSDEYLSTYFADGLIISTPTGSTAYSLSAGGPIVHPGLQAIILTPICPHTLGARPVIISNSEVIKIQVKSGHEDIIVTIDGQSGIDFAVDDTLLIQKGEFPIRLVKIDNISFFHILREKFHWGRPEYGRERE